MKILSRGTFGIRTKFASFVATVTFFIVVVSVVIQYRWVSDVLLDQIGEDYTKTADLLASSVTRMVRDQVRDVEIHYRGSFFQDALKEANLQYQGMDQDAIEQMFKERDTQWAAERPGSSVVAAYLNNPAARELDRKVQEDSRIAEAFITDQWGGLVCSSGKTSDFYQADEKWWKDAYASSHGGALVSGIEHDESAGMWVMTVAAPIKDESGAVIGVVKVAVDAAMFFEGLTSLEFGQTGNVLIVDSDNRIVYKEGTVGSSEKFLADKDFGHLWKRKTPGVITVDSRLYDTPQVVAVSVVGGQMVPGLRVLWFVCVVQTVDEVLAPLRALWVGSALLLAGMFVLILPFGFAFGTVVTQPILRLYEATRHVASGNLSYRIRMKRKDEVGDLARSFDDMVEKLAATTASRDDLNREVAERKVMEEQLRAAVKQLEEQTKELAQAEKLASLGRLVADMAHEVNNPLMVISGNAQIALGEKTDNPEIRESLETILSESHRARDIMQRLLRFSSPAKGQSKPVDINDVIEFVVKLLEHQYSLRSIDIVRKYMTNAPVVQVDEKQMHEVFMNLLNNAADAISEKGSITIATSIEADFLRIEFRDSGEGISEEDLHKIFDPFFTTKEKGTGLGLSVCYGIIVSHEGQMRYESMPGEGTAAIILLPFAKDARPVGRGSF